MTNAHKLAKDQKTAKRMHAFLDAWKRHVKQALKFHLKLKKGGETLDHHIKETIKLQKKLLVDLKKI